MGARFPTTRWSRVLTARDGTDTEARLALETLCQTYWHPLYVFVRCHGQDPDEARDLVQAYFTELLEKSFLKTVEPGRGRFRSFLIWWTRMRRRTSGPASRSACAVGALPSWSSRMVRHGSKHRPTNESTVTSRSIRPHICCWRSIAPDWCGHC